ncbi:MAG: hypothetical protein J6X55_02030 [Victivallales bacterium]|nr:hypothetical protein [Victivallales bacterium]
MDYQEFIEALEIGGEVIQRSFDNWQTPVFFFQFSAGFELDNLFDESPQALEMCTLPMMPPFHTPDRHQPILLYGTSDGYPILVASGHRHLFEGLGVAPCILPTCLAWKLGISRCTYIDPVLSLIPELKTGTWTLLTDFINGHHLSPLDGLFPLLEVPFPDMTHALSQRLNSELVNALSRVAVSPRLCIYEALPGSHFCTPAEAQMARAGHAELVGHDMVMEIITAHALGCQVAALGLVAEMAPAAGTRPLQRSTMLENCRFCSEPLLRGLRMAISEIADAPSLPNSPMLPEATADEALFSDFKRPSGKEPTLKRFLKH